MWHGSGTQWRSKDRGSAALSQVAERRSEPSCALSGVGNRPGVAVLALLDISVWLRSGCSFSVDPYKGTSDMPGPRKSLPLVTQAHPSRSVVRRRPIDRVEYKCLQDPTGPATRHALGPRLAARHTVA